MATSNISAGSWASLPTPLTPWVLDVIESMGHSQMTPVQASTIPLFMRHKDVVVEAVTGSGKTLAFVIPILERLVRRESKLRKNEIGALIISPTRELASQIYSIFRLFLSSQPTQEDAADLTQHPEPLLLVSSSQSSPSQDLQRFLAAGSDIVIGTPGRVEEFLLGKGKTSVSVKELEVLVLDEADRLLDLGFQVTLSRILTHLPKQRRTGLFSATMTDADALSELIRVGLRNPARIVVKVQSKRAKTDGQGTGQLGGVIEERRIPAKLQIFFLPCQASEKLLQLTRLISHEVTQYHSSQFIVYFSTGACVDYFYKVLPILLPSSMTFYSLHGNLPPTARTRTLSAFSSAISIPSNPSILLATDVAARGLDLPHVDVVIQFDPPSDPKAFSHRCGRTARAGRNGRAWILLLRKETEYVDFMAVRKIPINAQPGFSVLDGAIVQMTEESPNEDPEVDGFLSQIRSFLLSDRVLHDQAARAFVSFVRAYSKHEASYIFRLKDLDLIGVARSFGLLRLPKMPELKDADRSRWEDATVEWSTYSYADEAQEAKRLAEAASAAERAQVGAEQRARRIDKKKLNTAWSSKIVKKEVKEKRRVKKSQRKQWQKLQPVPTNPADSSTPTPKRNYEAPSDSGGDDGDWALMQREERMAKKVKKGEMSQTDFDMEFGDV